LLFVSKPKPPQGGFWFWSALNTLMADVTQEQTQSATLLRMLPRKIDYQDVICFFKWYRADTSICPKLPQAKMQIRTTHA
jgi:hypothetical protein